MPFSGNVDIRARFVHKFVVIAFNLVAVFLTQVDANRALRTDGHAPGQRLRPGVCRFGRAVACCYGWRNVNDVCQPVCEKPCGNGDCVGPDTCSCHAGFRGQYCREDVNECGLPIRPCSQRCMNTVGSYRCYCDPGYTLGSDGKTCSKGQECNTLRCQYGCQIERGGGVVCLCPSGLQLASDNRTCKDIDECKGPSAVCSSHQHCRNTFGSYVCVCRDGFVLGTLQESITCRDTDECLLSTHRCSRHAVCANTPGSYRCQCVEDYAGDGFTCRRRRGGRSRASMHHQYKLSKRTAWL